jgi:hypothetical protein
MDKKKYLPLLILLFCLTGTATVMGQISISGQIRTRTELRNGQGLPQEKDASSALFTSQRTRLNVGYSGYRFKVYTSIQDVRVWGQDGSTINRNTVDANAGFLMHEGWAEISLVDTGKVIKNFSLKIGRQELVYDDVRLLGNLDWLQQARRHDAMLLKFDHNGWTAHLGVGYNQNSEKKVSTVYTGASAQGPASTNGQTAMYKSMQFLYVGRKHHFGNSSFLFFKDDFSKFHYAATDVEQKTPIYEKGVWSRYTTGVNMFGTAKRKFSFALSGFYQFGKYRDGSDLGEYFLSGSFMYAAGRKWSFGPGVDMTSGNDGSDASKKYQRFDPLYGTPHKFWGYMDYFYVADGFGANGLTNYYFKTKYKAKDNLLFSLDAHEFMLPSAVQKDDGTKLSKKLGTELDFIVVYGLTKAITLEGGYCAMFNTNTMTSTKVKNVPNAQDYSDWAYLMINIKPSEIIIK